jgi:hypothetical protein
VGGFGATGAGLHTHGTPSCVSNNHATQPSPVPSCHPTQCRRVLKYTYVYGYYMPAAAPERVLFEDLQVRA